MASPFKDPNQNLEDQSLSQQISFAHRRLIALEVMAVFFGSLLASTLRFDQSVIRALTEYPGAPKVFIYPLIWYFFLYQTHSWDRSILYLSNDYYIRTLNAAGRALITFAAIAYLLKYPISRIWVLANAIGITVLLLAIRFLLRLAFFRSFRDGDQLRYIYIGDKSSQDQALSDFQSAYGFRPVFHRLEPPSDGKGDSWLAEYESTAKKIDAYGVLIGVGQIQDAAILRRLADTNRSHIIDYVLATRIGAISNRFEQLESPVLVRIRESSLVSSGSVIKRIFDVIFSFSVLVIALPLFLIVSLFIKLTSKGPILYVDKRVGKDGKLFTFPKFRSMYQGADRERLSILGRPDESMAERYKSDPRITPFGRVIRRWSIDELPQFWCVLIGTMSVVGPRPILQEELVQIHDNYQMRFLAKPGLTGLWQVTGRKEVPWNERMLRDVTYIDNWSFSNDLFLIWKTLGAIVKGQGAH